jgi:hypothetical protein
MNYHSESSHPSFSICILYNIILIKFEETLSKTFVIGSINFYIFHYVYVWLCNIVGVISSGL